MNKKKITLDEMRTKNRYAFSEKGLEESKLVKKGIYLVFRQSEEKPEFIPENPVQKSKGEPVHYKKEDLEEWWAYKDDIIYIGQTTVDLGGRLKPYIKGSSAHGGGKAIWQLDEPTRKNLTFAYHECENPKELEKELIALFEEKNGKKPFANRNN